MPPLSPKSLVLLALVTGFSRTNTEAEVVAAAIAAFQHNNSKRRSHGLAPLEAMTIPCITMAGTRPTFYLVPVTTALSEAVITGQYPAAQMRVRMCATVATRSGAGMEDVGYRELALGRFLAFKVLAKSHWVHVLAGF